MLEAEIKFYEANLKTWLSEYGCKAVLVKGASLIGVFDSLDDALVEGAKRYGTEPFLARILERESPEVQIPALTLGLIRADSTPSSNWTSAKT